MARRKSYPASQGTKVVRARRAGKFHGDDAEGGGTIGSRQWWKCDEGLDAAMQLQAWVERLRPWWVGYGMMDLVHEAIYRGRPLGATQTQNLGTYLLLRSGSLLNLNVVMSCVDTATARLTKRRPMPMIGADDADYSEKEFAKQNSRILRRKMGSTRVEKMSPLLIRDFCIRGDGCAKIERHGGDVRVKRIPIYELVVDPFEAEASGGEFRTLAHVRPEPREMVAARYPKYERQIMDAPAYARSEPWLMHAYQGLSLADYIEVSEAWHLPSAPGADDGQHIVCIKGQCVMRRRWHVDRFPVKFSRWSPPTRGFRGEGLVSQLAGIQEQINDILKDAREGLKNGSQLTIFVQRGANVNKHHLRARHPKVVEFDGVEPHYVAPNPVSEQAIRILLMLIDQAYQISGISQMNAQGKNTLGANASGRAIDTMDDLQSDRFAHVEADYQQFRVELGEGMLDEAHAMYCEAHGKTDADDDDNDDTYEETPDPIEPDCLAPWIRNGQWDRVCLDDGTYHVALEPVNYLADARSGKLDQVNDLGKAGLIPDPAIQADLFDEPDIAAANRVILGPKHNIDSIISGLKDVSVPMLDLQPDQYMNLPLGVLMVKGELNEAQSHRRHEHPDENLEIILERFRQWIELAKAEITRAEQGAMATSPQGLQAGNMVAAQNASTLQPGLGGPAPAPAMGPPMPGDPGMAPPGMIS